MARLIVVGLRLLVWCLLTADLEAANLAIGLAVALALPQPRGHRHLPASLLARAILASLRAIPQAYAEALALLWRRPGVERLELTPAEWPNGTGSMAPPHAVLVFLDVFRITLTPFTIALGMDPGGRHYRVHRLEER